MAGYRPIPPPNVTPTTAHQNRSTMYHPMSTSHGIVYPTHGPVHGLNIHGQHTSQLSHHTHHQMMVAVSRQQQQQQQQHHQQHPLHAQHHHLQQQQHHLGATTGAGQHHSAATRQMFNHMQTSIVPLNANGEPIKLPDNLESLPRADHFPTQRHRWNTNEEIAAILISFDKHSEWQSKEVKTRPKSGSLLLYSRKKVRYRRDGYCWKKRKDGKTTREDHMKLKVQGTECIYGCYVHSAILPTFHRRCYWLLQNPDIVLVHYLNVPYPDDNKMAVITPSLALWGDKKEWTKEELVSQLKPMFFSEDEPDASNEIEISTAETVEAIVGQLMEKQRLARQAALVKQLECGCPDSTCADGKSCSHPMRRISAAKSLSEKRQENNNQVSSTTPNVLIGPRLYSRWVDRRGRDPISDITQKSLDGSIHFQVIPSLHSHSSLQSHHHHQQQQQQQQQQQHHMGRQNTANISHSSQTNQQLLTGTSSTSIATSIASSANQPFTNASNHGNQINRITNNNVSQMIINTSHNSISTNTSSIGVTTLANNTNNNNTSNNNNHSNSNSSNQLTSHSNQQISLAISSDNNNLNNLTNNDGHHQQQQHHHHQHHHHQNHLSMSSGGSNSTSSGHQQQLQSQQQQQQQHSHHPTTHHHHHHHQSVIDSNVVNQRVSSNLISNTTNGRMSMTGGNGSSNNATPVVTSAPPLVLNLSQLQNSGGSLLILNGQQQSFVCQSPQQQQQQQRKILTPKDDHHSPQPMTPILVPKQEAMDSSSSTSDKQLDSVYDTMSYSSTAQNTPMESPSKESSLVKDLNDSLPFFNETLDLSQEDIQKTLSANMPLSANSVANAHDDGIDSDINPMDFIDNVCDVGVSSDPSGSNGHDPDDVFVNLDAFDMLVEFPDLELDTKSAFPQNTLEHLRNHDGNSLSRMDPLNQNMFNITDYSPEWAYPEGGVKVLVTGPWNSSSSYTVLFDSFPVPTTVVQSGVLRCYCPAHEVGLATLQVACDGYVISNSVIFEYKSPPNMETTCEGTTNDSLYKFTLLNRLSSIDDRMQIKSEPKDSPEDASLIAQSNFEERLVSYCQLLTNKTWRSMTPGTWPAGHRGMTLLHLASALGYSKLVCAMLSWRAENPNVILETEIDALSQDIQGYTPLTWACARGHCETAIILYKWNHNSLVIKNCLQQTPLDVAKMNGFMNVASELERLERNRINGQQQSQSTLPLGTFTTKHLNSPNNDNNNTNNSKNTCYTYDKLSSNTNKIDNSSNAKSENSIQKGSLSASYNNNNDNQDVEKQKTQQYSSSSLSASSNLQNRSSKSGNVKDNETTSNNLSNASNENLSTQCLSPNSNGSVGSMTSNRSHDGVFLRPGAVSSGQSPPSMRLTKRPSVDSGINMDMRTALSRSGKMFRDQHSKYQSFDSNDNNFSNSLDSAMDSNSGNSSTTSGSLLSPLRKMDFALCEVSAGDSSPMQDKQPGSSSDDEDITDPNNLTDNGVVVGESDAKVLTLAEHIIAAMPERIKNESEEIMSLGSPMSESLNTDTSGMGGLNDTFMEPLLDSLPNPQFEHEFNFEFSDHSYRYHDVGTPCSSLSPASSGPLQSPASYSVQPDPPMSSPSPPPSAQELTEFLQASNITQRPFEADFSNLTLTDREQRELYEAAKCIQKAYRSYKGRKKLEEQDKERSAAIVIQNYYRRYKQFAYYRQMTHAALVIQNGYRSYCENKRFKKSQNQNTSTDSQDSQCLQDYYKNYQNDQQQVQQNTGTASKEASPSGPLKRTYSQRTQNQAARKIQQFMRQSKMKLQRERAEKERLAHQRRAEYLQSSQYPAQQETGHIQDPNELGQSGTNTSSTGV